MDLPHPDPQQLTLDLPHHTALGLEDFYESDSNRMALQFIRNWPESGLDRRVLITGPEGCGKTHLAHVWMEMSGATRIDLNNQDVFRMSGIAVVIEDIDRITTRTDEEKLFHLYNHLHHSGSWLLMTAAKPVNQMGIQIPDLLSRLQNTLDVGIEEPDDALLRAVLAKHFHDRQMEISPRILDYCVARMERSFVAAAALVDRLDKQSLSEKRPVSFQMVQKTGL
mgnify:CR=1 FL=1